MKAFNIVVSVVMLLFATLSILLAIILHDKNLILYEQVADAFSYVGVILLSLFISFYLLDKGEK